jgi:uncharacterized protein YlxW (UPF0749 family)
MTAVLEMTEKQRHRAMRRMAEEDAMVDSRKEIDDRVARINELEHKIEELSSTLDTVNQQRISAEATRFAALHILEDIVTNADDLGGGDYLVRESSYKRAAAMVANHRGQ